MAHPYTTVARLRLLAQQHRVAAYSDHNADGVDDTSVISGAIERACNHIDTELGLKFSVPFAATSGVATAGKIADLTDILTLAYLLHSIDYERAQALLAEAQAVIDRIVSGKAFIDASLRTAAVRSPVVFQAGPSFAAGNVDDEYPTDRSAGSTRLRGV